jgi:polyhydroxyalkanoate synthesis regulator phasin
MLNSEGSVPFEESLKKLVEKGHISYEEAEKYIDDKTVL